MQQLEWICIKDSRSKPGAAQRGLIGGRDHRPDRCNLSDATDLNADYSVHAEEQELKCWLILNWAYWA